MKRITIFTFFIVSSFSLYAQNEEKTVVLNEVTIKGAKVVNKVDGQTIYPTDAQKDASSNGYSILQKLSLPNLRVDDVAHTISAIDDKGSVQLRINGIIVGKQEMIALDPKLISKVDFIDNPGVRYGEDIAYVINIVTRKADSGYTIGAELAPTLTAWQGSDMAYGKWNVGKSEFSVSYNFSGHKLKGSKA
ncbi:MAG: TonB-dependent receptor, partial [Prevotella sp.]|nr:TonB-dependent receptor [Prevotella sp.]